MDRLPGVHYLRCHHWQGRGGRLQVAVLNSESEGLSDSLIEYAVLGLPVVTYDTGGNREVVVDEETGCLVPEGDVEALADRVCRLLEDGELRGLMEEEGRRRSLELFYPRGQWTK